MDCLYRTNVRTLRIGDKDVETSRCTLINAELGWPHGIGVAQCEACLADPDHARSLEAAVNRSLLRQMLVMRISQFHHWDSDPAASARLTVSYEQALVKLKALAGDTVASDALVKAVRNGFDHDAAIELAERYFPNA